MRQFGRGLAGVAALISIAAQSATDPGKFANATKPPPSSDPCSILFRIVPAGSMEPITSGFQIALDPTVDPAHRPHYVIGLGTGGHIGFAGGGLHEVTAEMKSGVLRIENAPPQFDMELCFTDGGCSSAIIYRQCAGPEASLIYAVRDADNLAEGGDWLWVKAPPH